MSLLTYSGITAKVKAMESRLISHSQFRELASFKDIQSAVDYLKQQTAYTEVFSRLDHTKLHRGYIEQLLTQSEYQDFSKLYRFSNQAQRKFLKLYFMHYEIHMIKHILRNIMGHQKAELELSLFQSFFHKHSSMDLTALAQSKDLAEFILGLKGSVYYDLLAELEAHGRTSLFDYEMHLDFFYFKSVWNANNKVLPKKEQRILNPCLGCHIDLLNVQWIYRSKKYYSLPAAHIYPLLIPVSFKLKTSQITNMAEASSMEEFFQALERTYYGKLSDLRLQDAPELKTLHRQILNRIYNRAGRRHPYSVAVLASYLYFKELERRKIITAIEGIRYGLGANEILSLIIKQ